MKKKSVLVALLVMLCVPVLFLTACGNKPAKNTYTVTYNTDGGSHIQSVEAKPNTRITKPSDPTHPEGFIFEGWFKEAEFISEWDFELDIVKANTTIYAKWLKFYDYPNNIKLAHDEPFTNKITWVQKNVNKATTTLNVKVNNVDVPGTWEIKSDGLTIEFTPTSPVGGGNKTVLISTTRTGETIKDVSATVAFNGTGTESDPYLIYNTIINYEYVANIDFLAIAEGDFNTTGKYFKQMEDFKYESKIDNKLDKVFNGNYNGNGKTITLSGNCGIFYSTSTTATVKNINFLGGITTGEIASIGPVANYNAGTVEGINSVMAVESKAGAVGDISKRDIGGGAAVVGTNQSTGIIKNCTFDSNGSSSNTIKVSNGGAGIAGVNYGLIEKCIVKGGIGAFNTVEVGKTLSGYSFQGGIAGYNYGTIKQSALSGVGKILAQRYATNAPAEEIGRNIVIGGIAGLNGTTGLITECYYDGVRVHGDQYVGGIAGINEGRIENSMAGPAFHSLSGSDPNMNRLFAYVGGRKDVGGIAGVNRGSQAVVTNCVAGVNVYAYDGKPYAVSENATNCVYFTNNPNARLQKAQGDPAQHLYGVPPTNTLIAPNGNGNVAYEIPVNSNIGGDAATGEVVVIKIEETYLTNLGDKFTFDATSGVTLAWRVTA